MNEVITRVHARHRLQSSTAAMSVRQPRQVASLITPPPPPHSRGISSALYSDAPEESASYAAEQTSLSHALLHTVREKTRVEQESATHSKAFPEVQLGLSSQRLLGAATPRSQLAKCCDVATGEGVVVRSSAALPRRHGKECEPRITRGAGQDGVAASEKKRIRSLIGEHHRRDQR